MIKLFVFDTNSLISANLSLASINRKAYDTALEIGILIYSDESIKEFLDTFLRPKFDKYVSLEKRMLAVNSFRQKALLSKTFSIVTACRDPKDNKFLELAIDAKASCIITGDKDLLVLHPFNKIPILSAADFLKEF